MRTNKIISAVLLCFCNTSAATTALRTYARQDLSVHPAIVYRYANLGLDAFDWFWVGLSVGEKFSVAWSIAFIGAGGAVGLVDGSLDGRGV